MPPIDARLAELGIVLPAPLAPPPGVQFPFVPVRVHDGLAHVSGHGPFDGSKLLFTGTVGADLTVDQGHQAARATCLSMLASLKQELGTLDRVTEWIKLLGLV